MPSLPRDWTARPMAVRPGSLLCFNTTISEARNTTLLTRRRTMLNEQTINMLNVLKLFGMAHGLEERLNSAQQADLSHADFVGLLVQDEKTFRDNQRLKRLLRNARLRQPAALEDIDYRHARGLSKQVMLELSGTQWIDTHRSVLLTGPSGIGKSYISCALGNFAARAGYAVLYLRAPRMFETLQQS